MKLKVKILKFLAGRPVCMIHEKTAKTMSLHVDNRVSIEKRKKKIISIIDTVSGLVTKKEIGVSDEIVSYLGLKNDEIIDVEIVSAPESIDLIKKKLKGEELNEKEIYKIINDISKNALTEAEIAFFISAVYEKDMSIAETKNMIKAMVKTGRQLKLRGKVVDKHSIGGVAGNRTTPLVISICAAEGLIMPKTSSRAITSASGTADVIEVFAKVDFSLEQIKKIIHKTKAFFVWGGSLGLAPVDDKIIRIERIVKLDSEAQLLASILSKKISVDSKYILIDVPYGKSAKVSKREAEKLKLKFLNLGKKFDLKLEVVLTDGSQPIGNGIGPVLEMLDILRVLKRESSPKDLEDKSVMLAGRIFEMIRKSKKGKGEKLARRILDSGKAFAKFKEIIEAQSGKIKKLELGKYTFDVHAEKNLVVKSIDNKLVNSLARTAGCPEDKSAGIYLYKKVNQKAEKGEKLLTIYATSEEKLKYAIKFYKQNQNQIIVF